MSIFLFALILICWLLAGAPVRVRQFDGAFKASRAWVKADRAAIAAAKVWD